MTLSPLQLREYQRRAVLHQLYHDDSMLWLDTGLGKTVITLSAIEHRMRAGQVKKTLIFGPLRVIYTVWEEEARKWEHTQHLRFSIVHGSIKQREAALFRAADVYLCNYESMAWLAGELKHYYIDNDKPLPFQMVVYDEVTKVKNSQSQRVKGGWKNVVKKAGKLCGTFTGRSLKDVKREGWTTEKLVTHGLMTPAEVEQVKVVGWRAVLDLFKYRTGLTGTPAANGYIDLMGQYLAVDGGERLGAYITHYRDAYFTVGYDNWTYAPTSSGITQIQSKISDITMEMKAEDYLSLPGAIVNTIVVDLPATVRKSYDEIEEDLFTKLDDGTEIELFNKASLSNKCLQFCNGAPYKQPGSPEWSDLHTVKLEALDDIIEEAGGSPVFVAYTFKADAERIMKRYAKKKCVNITTTPARELSKVIERWQRGEIEVMVGHPASMAHGIDGLQKGGHIVVWVGLTWNLELYIQLNRRFDRHGQTKPVMIHRILCRDTVDFAVADSLNYKGDEQDELKKSIHRYRTGQIDSVDPISFI